MFQVFNSRSSAWLVATVLFGTALGCSSEQAEQSKKPPDPTPEKSDSPGAIASSIKESTPIFDKKEDSLNRTEVKDKDELFRVLAQTRVEQQRVTDKQQLYDIQIEREQAASRLLEMNLNPEQRFQTIRAKLDAQLRLIGLGDENANSKLEKFAGKLVDDADEKVAQAASISLLARDMTTRMQVSHSGDLQPIIDQAATIAARYPDSVDVCRELLDLAEGMSRLNRREEAVQMLAALVEQFQASQNPQIGRLVDSLKIRLRLANLNLDQIMSDLRENKPGSLERYEEAIAHLISDPEFGASLLQEIINSLHWLEGHQVYGTARSANQIVENASKEIADEPLRSTLQHQCQMLSTRLGLLNNPLRFDASTAAGEPLNWDRYRDKVVIVVFWSTSEPRSMQTLRSLSVVHQKNVDRGVELLAIDVSPDLKPLKSLFGDQLPPWDIVVSDHPATSGSFNNLAEQFGVVRVPFVALVDRKRHVVSINVTSQELQNKLDALLASP